MNDLVTYLSDEPIALITVVSIFGLIVGSFLNVVIHRLPLMMEREWREQCHEFLGLPVEPSGPSWNLIVPRSHCPKCGHSISALENIPILSYLWQKGRCTACQQAISIRYPRGEGVMPNWKTPFEKMEIGINGGLPLLKIIIILPLSPSPDISKSHPNFPSSFV